MPDCTTDLLLKLGIHSTYRGFWYLRYALTVCLEDERRLLSVRSSLYENIASYFDTSKGNVERCMRTAISFCWNHGNRSLLCEIAKYPLSSKPTNSEFIDILYHYLQDQT